MTPDSSASVVRKQPLADELKRLGQTHPKSLNLERLRGFLLDYWYVYYLVLTVNLRLTNSYFRFPPTGLPSSSDAPTTPVRPLSRPAVPFTTSTLGYTPQTQYDTPSSSDNNLYTVAEDEDAEENLLQQFSAEGAEDLLGFGEDGLEDDDEEEEWDLEDNGEF